MSIVAGLFILLPSPFFYVILLLSGRSWLACPLAYGRHASDASGPHYVTNPLYQDLSPPNLSLR